MFTITAKQHYCSLEKTLIYLSNNVSIWLHAKKWGYFKKNVIFRNIIKFHSLAKGPKQACLSIPCIGPSSPHGHTEVTGRPGGQPKRASSLRGVCIKSKIDREKSLSTKISYKYV